MAVWYNEIDPFAAHWLRNLAAAGHIPAGDVETRSIRELAPEDCGAAQCHFFSGIGGWPLALRLAGWPVGAPVWTGSCPCQPFSVAGRRRALADERHLWPVWFELIRERRPPVVFGEQVAGPDGLGWLDSVSADLEGCGYAFGAAVLPAASVGAPHERHRIYWVADGDGRPGGQGSALGGRGDPRGDAQFGRGPRGHGGAGRLGDAHGERVQEQPGGGHRSQAPGAGAGLSDRAVGDGARAPGAARGPWSDLVWLPCGDGTARPTQPGLRPLAHGVSGRVAVVRPGEQADTAIPETHWYNRSGALKGFGNAIVPQVAAVFVRAYLEAREGVA